MPDSACTGRILAAEASRTNRVRRTTAPTVPLFHPSHTPERSPSHSRLGMGLDENALKAVTKYRFKPAMFDGKPVPVKIKIEVNFRVY